MVTVSADPLSIGLGGLWALSSPHPETGTEVASPTNSRKKEVAVSTHSEPEIECEKTREIELELECEQTLELELEHEQNLELELKLECEQTLELENEQTLELEHRTLSHRN